WRGKAKLISYEGQNNSDPISKEQCEVIKSLANHGAKFLVRNGYYSHVAFEMPFFLTSEFIPSVLKAANEAGFPFSFVEISNPPVTILTDAAELRFRDDATSNILGDISELAEQLNLSRKGAEDGLGNRTTIVSSGDILCDLAHGQAEMIMTYP